jgi:pantetheine-phosphate adenylyltransferase
VRVIFKLTPKLVSEFRKPHGRLFRSGEKLKRFILARKPPRLIGVGDYCSLLLQDLGLPADLSVIDGKILRDEIGRDQIEKIRADLVLRATNPPGIITQDAWDRVKEALSHSVRVRLEIAGEEDLLVIPCVWFSPPHSLIVYGIAGRSCALEVTGWKKRRMLRFLDRTQFDHVLIGGSWDHLHAGHKFILLTAFEWGRHVEIGITSDRMLRTKLGERGEPVPPLSYARRLGELGSFLKEFGLSNFNFTQLDDWVGPALERGEALVVSDETYGRGLAINRLRRRAGQPPLKIIKIDRIRAEDGQPISSRRIRAGHIDREGFVINPA